MKTNKELLENLIAASNEAAGILLIEDKIITNWTAIVIHIQNIDKQNGLIEIARDYQQSGVIVNKLRSSSFLKNKKKIHQVIHLNSSIIPAGTYQNLYEETVKHKGEIWIIYKNDSDPFPSNPHAHNYEAGLKLHLGNGGLFLRSKCVGKINRKDLKKVRSKIKNIELPELEPK